jgi:predicted deacetylase
LFKRIAPKRNISSSFSRCPSRLFSISAIQETLAERNISLLIIEPNIKGDYSMDKLEFYRQLIQKNVTENSRYTPSQGQM